MATTTNFGWETPDDTDLVKDGAAAIRTALGGVDTSFVDLKGGTTGQVLAKASGTDLDFSWVAVDPLTILDAKGDLITATAADTPARLAVGTNGQTLVADSTASTGLKWATPTTAGFVGCSLTYLTSSQAIANTTYTRVLFDSEDYDTDSFHSNVTNNGRITIPSGKAGKYLFTGFHSWGNYGTTGRVIAALYVNGVSQRSFGNETPSGYLSVQLSCALNLSVGDYVELFVYQASGATAYIQSDNELRFQANYLGA